MVRKVYAGTHKTVRSVRSARSDDPQHSAISHYGVQIRPRQHALNWHSFGLLRRRNFYHRIDKKMMANMREIC